MKIIPRPRSWLVAMAALGLAGSAHGSDLLFGYNLGLSYSSTTSYATISYDAPLQTNLPQDCSQNQNVAQTMRCSAYLAPDTSGVGSLSAFVEKPFVREGLFYFSPGVTVSTISYTGNLNPKPTGPLQGSSSNSSTNTQSSATGMTATAPGTGTTGGLATGGQAGSQPLTLASMSMYGANWQAYLRLGLTPLYLPDIMLSVGLGLQTVYGTIKVFKEKYTSFVIQPEGFAELELVLVRIAGGKFSLFLGLDQSLTSELSSKLIPDNPGGQPLSNFTLTLSAGSAGVRLLFPF